MSYKHLLEDKNFLSITEFSFKLKNLLEKEYQNIYLIGEISNLKIHSSGHVYFSLKDETSSIRAVIFRWDYMKVRFQLDNGLKIRAIGSLSVYHIRGEYQILVKNIEPDGIGALQLAFEQLKQKLEKLSYFDTSYKKLIPPYARNIGIITSPTGAVIKDIINVLNRRFSGGLNIFIFPCKVQGDKASEDIVKAIENANQRVHLEVLIIARGGGSIEDLWAFNEEIVAHAIWKSKLPIISAVGHEVDWTIADYVSDLRAPTPSAAAEMVVESKDKIFSFLSKQEIHLYQLIKQQIASYKQQAYRYDLNSFYFLFKRHMSLKKMHFDRISQNFLDQGELFLMHRKQKLDLIKEQLKNLNPETLIKRGYNLAYVLNSKTKKKELLKTAKHLNINDKVFLDIQDAYLELKLEKINEK